jgi:hypothetical protein
VRRFLLIVVAVAVGTVLTAELLVRVFAIQPHVECPDAGTILVVAGVSADDAELEYGCQDGRRFRPSSVHFDASKLRIGIPKRAWEQLRQSPRIKVIAVHHGGVGASAFLRTVDALAPTRRLRPWDYPDREVTPVDLPDPTPERIDKRHYLTFDLDVARIDPDTHISVIADPPGP